MHVDTWSQKLKADQKDFGWAFVKNSCGQAGHGTLKLMVSQKWTDRIKWFFHAGTNLGKLKVDSELVGMLKNGHVFLFHETLKSTVS